MRILAFLLVWPLVAHLHAQLVQPNVRMIDTRSGLSHDQVNAIAKDRRGYMWFGTGDGLSRFSGARMKVYKTDGGPGTIPNDHINALAIDSGGMLYIGSNSGFLTLLDPLQDTLANVPIPGARTDDVHDARISALFIDREARVWISHGHRKLSLFDPRMRSFRMVEIKTPNGNPQGRNFITRIVQDADGTLWLGTEFGLVQFDPSTFRYEQIRLDGGAPGSPMPYQSHVVALLVDGGRLILGTYGQGILVLDKSSGNVRRLWPTVTEQYVVQDLVWKDRDHAWVAGAAEGILLLNARSGLVERFDRSLMPALVLERDPFVPGAQCFLKDDEGTLWVGSFRVGVAAVAPRMDHFTQIALPSGPGYSNPEEVMRIATDPISGNWLVLSFRHGLYVIDTSGATRGKIGPPGDNPLLDMLVAPDGTVWVAIFSGLFIADLNAMHFRKPGPAIANSPCGGYVDALWPDGGHGGFWCDTHGRGIMHLDTTTATCTPIEAHAPGIGNHLGGDIRALLVDGQQRIWIGQSDRPPLVVFTDGSFIILPSRSEDPDGIPSVFVTDLAEGADGTIWASTFGHGLVGIALGADRRPIHRSITAGNELPSNMLYNLVATPNGIVWGGTKSGLFAFDPAMGTSRQFGLDDGLPTADIYQSFDLSPDGDRIFAGVHEGFVTFLHEQLTDDEAAPLVQVPLASSFEHAVRANADDTAGGAIRLRHDQHQVQFDLRSTNLLDPFNDAYAYRLIGSDTAWTTAPAQERITFSHLAPGRYTFEVRARTGNGPWGAIVRVPFTITPPFWATWWFRSLAIVAFMALAYAGFRAYLFMRLRRQREQHDREQAVMQERFRIASDMHDDLGSGLSVIKSSSEVAMMNERDPDRSAALKEIARGSGELIDSMRQIVWTLGSGQESLADLIAYLRSYSATYLDRHGIRRRFNDIDALPPRTLTSIERRNLLLLLKEALHNVVKHAGATEVTIMVRWEDGLHISIIDNGRGIQSQLPMGSGIGMRTMRQRVEQLGGTLEVLNGKGTTLNVHLPRLGSTERSIVST